MIDHQSPEYRSPFPQEIESGGIVLTLTRDQLYVALAEMPAPELDDFLAQYRLEPVAEERSSQVQTDGDEAVPTALWLRSGAGENTARVIAKIRADDRVATAAPVYHRADLLPSVTGLSLGDFLLVRFHPRAAEEEIRDLVHALGTEDVYLMPDEREGTLHQLRLRDSKQQEMFEIVAAFARSTLVRYAGPDWIQLNSPVAAIPNDYHFNQQWNLYRIEAPEGWDIMKGDSNIVIAIIDTGCDLNHPDLKDKFVPVSDRYNLSLAPGEGANQPEDGGVDDGHGTLSAGVAAATWNNNIGVAGVAPYCSIMPIRLWREKYETVGGIKIKSSIDFTESNVVRAIDWARNHGANVINMSWLYVGPYTNTDIALNNAHAAGLVLVAASGNCFKGDSCTAKDNVGYPAIHPYVIAVGASDSNDQRQNQKSPGVRIWESCYGSRLSVVAPTNVWTTYMKGKYGDFIGTSASAPHVAGLAALLLSLLQRPYNIPPFMQLNDLVRNIIEWTAVKVGGYSYATNVAHPNGTWHEEMGYGRIDVAGALRLARDSYTRYKLEQPNNKFAIAVSILLGLTSGGPGVVLPPGGPPVPVDPGWGRLVPEARDVLLGLAVTELAGAVSDLESRRALERAGGEAIERAARQIRR